MDKELKLRLNELENMFLRFVPRTSLQFQVDLTRHCNLKCKYCGNYSPLAEKEFLDLDEYQRDLARLSELFQGEAKRIILQGGEPLLHPQISEILAMTRKYFPLGDIRIITNGIPIPSMDEAFWAACRENRIEITPTEYPINFDYESCRKIAKERGAAYIAHTSGIDKANLKKMGKLLVSLKPLDRPERNFAHCDSANRCITLRHGKMYTCCLAATVGDLKKYFHLDLPVSKRNGIDIYQVKDGEELMRKLARAIPLCAHCDVSLREFYEDWRPSKKNRYEWLGFEFLDEDAEYLQAASSVYIFGAAELGMETLKWMKERGVNVEAILVTRSRGSETHIDGVPLMNVKDLREPDENSVCLLALRGSDTKKEVYPILMECGFKNILPVYGRNFVE